MRGPGRKHSCAEYAARLEAIEDTIARSLWSLRTGRELSARFGVDLRQIRRDAAKVKRIWKGDLPRDPEAAKAGLVGRLQVAEATALQEGRHDALAKHLRLRAEVTGALAPTQVEVAVVHAAVPVDQEALARRIVDAYPRACAVLGVSPAAPDAIEAVAVTVDPTEGSR